MEVIEIERHRLIHGDITISSTIETLMSGEDADLIYSDPPWGPGNQKYWHTMNRKGSLPRTDWDHFIECFVRICALYRKQDAPVFIEMGLRWTDQLDELMRRYGMNMVKRWETYYGDKRKPNKTTLALFGSELKDIMMPDPPHGEPCTLSILKEYVKPGMIVLDPCTGLGMTARLTHTLGGTFCGSELNLKRLEKTANWLRKRV